MAWGWQAKTMEKTEDKTDVFRDAPISLTVHATKELLQRSLLSHELREWQFSIIVSIHLLKKRRDLLPGSES